jgi:hypothetical protein
MSRNVFYPGFIITPHEIGEQLKALKEKLAREHASDRQMWTDTVIPENAFDDLPESRKAEIKRDKWCR